MSTHPKLGTRGSALALAQARKVASAIEVAQQWPSAHVEIVTVMTTGDKVQDRPLAEIGGKALWTKELDQALGSGAIDFAVHSLKDVESVRPKDIRIVAVRPRTDVRDRIIGAQSIDAVPRGARVGTSSPRRKAQLLRLRPDLEIVPLRGNVDTRLRKLESGEVDAIILAAAGLKRLGMHSVGSPIPVEQMLPAPGQAVIALECRTDDAMTARMLKSVDDEATHEIILVERAFTRALRATCNSPVGALATIERGGVRLRAQLLAADGSQSIEDEARFPCGDHASAEALARRMLARAPEAIRSLFAAA